EAALGEHAPFISYDLFLINVVVVVVIGGGGGNGGGTSCGAWCSSGLLGSGDLTAESVDDEDNDENVDNMQPPVPSFSVAHIAVRFTFSVECSHPEANQVLGISSTAATGPVRNRIDLSSRGRFLAPAGSHQRSEPGCVASLGPDL
ncbi:unnamed protein product, partial [Gongylonema pulchrum]|uniref:Secreted protein n=1 Tax=Gongylonema pulchrum TaxID=637853 RepID=A0A183D038_9BILA